MTSDKSILKNQIEFHRNGSALLPEKGSKEDGVAFYIGGVGASSAKVFCTCATSKRKTCSHLIKLGQVVKALVPTKGAPDINGRFRQSHWYTLAKFLSEGDVETGKTVSFRFDGEGEMRRVHVLSADGKPLAWLAKPAAGRRFLERCGKAPQKDSYDHRGYILNLLARHTLTADERTIATHGYRSRRQVMEDPKRP